MIKGLYFLTDISLEAHVAEDFDVVVKSKDEASDTDIAGQVGLKKPSAVGVKQPDEMGYSSSMRL